MQARITTPSESLDPVRSLADEHQMIAESLELLEGWANLAALGKLVERSRLQGFVTFLTDYVDLIHHEKEEVVLMPALFGPELSRTTGAMGKLREEHERERCLTDALRTLAYQNEPWTEQDRSSFVALAGEFVDFQRRHLESENKYLYCLVRTNLDDAGQAQLRADLERFDARTKPRRELLSALLASLSET